MPVQAGDPQVTELTAPVPSPALYKNGEEGLVGLHAAATRITEGPLSLMLKLQLHGATEEEL